MKESHDELHELLRRSPRLFSSAIIDLAYAIAKADPRAYDRARASLRETFAKTLSLADLVGQRRTILEAKSASKGKAKPLSRIEPILFGVRENVYLAADQPIVPRVRFDEAVEDLVTRQPELAIGWQEVVDLYSRKHAFALAKSTDLVVTKRVQKAIDDLLERGADVRSAREVIGSMSAWSVSYAETVFRTNLNTAYTNGRIRKAQDPAVAQVIGALEYVATLDRDVRPNHRAAHGFLASQFDPLWREWRPPLGYGCRCGTRMVDRWELESRGLLRNGKVARVFPSTWSSASRDPGFTAALAA